ncbi:class I SAM-dependent methyltransferase [Bradyrhizobium sp. CB82]|uniref:class I SAM-dependent methyltransferase n=1 Tax=Bradyrhizobium sp. CB82 TaxID=3039159 RepID=UPI0024B116DC|nr:class I SAM-dependent methyltransferase [Bradyrhizobium sp. CB82]WFU37356.1 class I SAM-dependent methyltransferase [Bradyrhizobium sp. CB82]
MSAPMRSNLEIWKRLRDENYFEKRPSNEAAQATQWFLPLRSDMRLAGIGRGYGRVTLWLAALMKHVYGIDVSETILKKGRRLVVRARRQQPYNGPCTFAQAVPVGIDRVFSIVVMQHLTRDLMRKYFTELGRKLVRGGQRRRSVSGRGDVGLQRVGRKKCQF